MMMLIKGWGWGGGGGGGGDEESVGNDDDTDDDKFLFDIEVNVFSQRSMKCIRWCKCERQIFFLNLQVFQKKIQRIYFLPITPATS